MAIDKQVMTTKIIQAMLPVQDQILVDIPQGTRIESHQKILNELKMYHDLENGIVPPEQFYREQFMFISKEALDNLMNKLSLHK